MKVAVSDTRRANGPIVLAVLGACFLVVMMDNTILNVALHSRAAAVITQAQNAFIQAMHASALIGIGALALGFLVALRWLSGRDPLAARSAPQTAARTEKTAIT